MGIANLKREARLIYLEGHPTNFRRDPSKLNLERHFEIQGASVGSMCKSNQCGSNLSTETQSYS